MCLINDINDNCSFVPNCREGQIKCTRGNYQDFLKRELFLGHYLIKLNELECFFPRIFNLKPPPPCAPPPPPNNHEQNSTKKLWITLHIKTKNTTLDF